MSIDLGILFLTSLIIVLPVFIYGIPNSADSSQHYQFAITFFDSLQNGDFYPSWAADSNRGFGDVGVRFYPPLAYYVMAGFRYLAGNWYDASVLTFGFWFFLSGVGLYFWCREWFDETSSLAAAIMYIFMPYHANQLYNAFTYAEFAGSAIIPFCFLFVTRLCRTGKIIDIVGLAVFYSLLILTHLPLTVIGSISLLIYSLTSLKKESFFPTLLKLSSAVFLGLVASSFYWVKMVSELDWVKHTTSEFTSNVYDFHINFLCSFLYTLLFQEDFRSTFLDRVLLVSAGVFISSAVIFYVWSKEKDNQKFFGVVTVLAFAIFITTPLSNIIWEKFSLLQKVQFPWRWLAIVSLTGAFFVAAGFRTLINLLHTKMRPAALLTFGLLTAAIVFTFTRVINYSIQLPRQEFAQQLDNFPRAQSCECWWAIWSEKAALKNTEKVSGTDRSAQVINWQATEREILFSSGSSAVARIPVFYYPHWKTTVNNRSVVPEVSNDGAILIPLPPETAQVKVWFQEPFLVQVSWYISILVWLFFAITNLSILATHQKFNKLNYRIFSKPLH